MDNSKIPCSVGILTFNSAKTLARALESVKDFQEIIICDGGSTDETLAIARNYGAKIINQNSKFKNSKGKIIDFSGVRNQLLTHSTLEWFVFIDSDEYFTNELCVEIRQIILSNGPGLVYRMNRKYVYNNKVIEASISYPNFQIRFFKLAEVDKFIKPIHERISFRSDVVVHTLKNHMLVPLDGDVKLMKDKWRNYLKLQRDFRASANKSKWKVFRVSLFLCLKYSFIYSLRLLRNYTLGLKRSKLPLQIELVWYWQYFAAVKNNLVLLFNRST